MLIRPLVILTRALLESFIDLREMRSTIYISDT